MNKTLLRKADAGLAAAAALPVLLPLLVVSGRLRDRLRSGDPEAGSVVEWILVIAVVITIVAVVGVLIRNALVSKAGELDFSTQ